MLGNSNTRERPRIEPKAHVSDTGTLSAADSLRLHWPEYLMARPLDLFHRANPGHAGGG